MIQSRFKCIQFVRLLTDCWVPPHPSQASHGRPIFLSPEEHRAHNGRQEPKLKTKRKGNPAWSPLRAVPAEPQPQCPGVKPIAMSHGEQLFRLPLGLRGVTSWKRGTHKGIQGKSFWELHGVYYGMFRGGTKGRTKEGFRRFEL